MISHILFNLFSKYNIGSFGFRKILAILITVLIFGLLYMTVRFTGMDIPNYTRNLIMLVTVDLAGFLFLMWKQPKEPPKEEEVEVKVEVNEEKVEEVTVAPVVVEKSIINDEEVKGDVEDNSEQIVIKKIEEVDEVDEVDKDIKS
jgi:hypothetical protein